MIKKIKMRNCATYDNEGIEISECAKINFIYGPNGSGKSTISNFFQSPTESKFKDCSVEWENNNTSEILVYNRSFREKNFSTGKSDIAGIFTLGESTIEDLKTIEELKAELALKQNDINTFNKTLNKKQTDLENCENQFRENIWDAILKRYSEDFQAVFQGVRRNKERFKECVIEKFNKNITPKFSLTELQERKKALYETKSEQCAVPSFNFESLINSFSIIEDDIIWQKIIVGNTELPIAKLMTTLGNSDWVNKGRNYIIGNGYCPFCQQMTITDKFKEELEQFFSGEYEKDISVILQLKEEYFRALNDFKKLIETVQSSEVLFDVGKLDVNVLNDKIEIIITILNANLSNMESKIKEPSRKIELTSTSKEFKDLTQLIINSQNIINKHNKLVLNFAKEQEQLVNDIWEYMLNEQKSLIENYLSEKEKHSKGIAALTARIYDKNIEVSASKKAIIEAEKNITSVQPTVNEINRLLKAYGFENFLIVESPVQENYYQIQRPDGSMANNTLSEGEETFISFLYFMQLAKGAIDETKVVSKKILFIDDPICSLDSTILYIVSAMIKELSKDVKEGKLDVEQLFILTHNVFFHKEAAFIDGRTKEDNKVHFWILNKNFNITQIISYNTKNPITTSYELLWKELKDNTTASLVTTQNVMRRIIENYFGILGKNKDDMIVNSFSSVEEQLICKSLLCWINDGSHSIPDDLYIDSYVDSIDKYKEVFRQIFIKTNNETHYNMMMGITSE